MADELEVAAEQDAELAKVLSQVAGDVDAGALDDVVPVDQTTEVLAEDDEDGEVSE